MTAARQYLVEVPRGDDTLKPAATSLFVVRWRAHEGDIVRERRYTRYAHALRYVGWLAERGIEDAAVYVTSARWHHVIGDGR